MANDLNLGELKITLETLDNAPVRARFDLPNGSSVARNFPQNGELTMRLGLGLGLTHSALSAPPALLISGTPVTTATEGAAYDGFIVTASGGAAPYTYSLVGTWPAGISIDASTGAVSGTPTESGSFADLSVRVTDAASNTADLGSFTLTVAAVSVGLQYVGGKVASTDGTTSAWSTSLTDLTGGMAAAPAPGDIVIVAYGVGSSGDVSIGVNTAGYTEIAELFADDSNDANLSVSWKIMSSTPDTSIDLSSTTSVSYAGAVAIHVWRGVDHGTPMDVGPQTATGANSGNANPPAITPITPESVIICCGAVPAVITISPPSDLQNFISGTHDDTLDAVVGMGSTSWAGDTFDPTAWTISPSILLSWAAVTLALRPA